jgi:hypothetical protein
VLEWLRLDRAGERKGDDVPVFSNEAGEQLKTFKKAWVVAVPKAHGVNPCWHKGSYKDPPWIASCGSVRSTCTRCAPP